MIISIYREKKNTWSNQPQTQHPFMIKALNQPGIERNFFNLVKPIYEKPITKSILNGENCKLSS